MSSGTCWRCGHACRCARVTAAQPADYMHQENLESDTLAYAVRASRIAVPSRVQAVSGASRRFFACPKATLTALARKHVQPLIAALPPCSARYVRDWLFPAFARMYYEMLWHEECPDDVAQLIVASGWRAVLRRLNYV